MQLGLGAWHRYMTSGDPELLPDLLAADVVFHSPANSPVLQGRDKVSAYLAAAAQVFGSGGEFRYVRELVDGAEACLEFETTLDGTGINGVDLIRFDIEGRVVELKVMLRTVAAIELVGGKMAAALQAA